MVNRSSNVSYRLGVFGNQPLRTIRGRRRRRDGGRSAQFRVGGRPSRRHGEHDRGQRDDADRGQERPVLAGPGPGSRRSAPSRAARRSAPAGGRFAAGRRGGGDRRRTCASRRACSSRRITAASSSPGSLARQDHGGVALDARVVDQAQRDRRARAPHRLGDQRELRAHPPRVSPCHRRVERQRRTGGDGHLVARSRRRRSSRPRARVRARRPRRDARRGPDRGSRRRPPPAAARRRPGSPWRQPSP